MLNRSTLLPPRFWAKVRIGPDGFHSQTGANLGPCWLWIGYIKPTGYGRWNSGDKINKAVHRSAYIALVGPVPKGLDLDHLCRVRHCCNPKHLESVTRKVNTLRGEAGKENREKKYCLRGHAFTPANTLQRGNGRACRACQRLRSKAHKARTQSV